jgi:hypothetical protein
MIDVLRTVVIIVVIVYVVRIFTRYILPALFVNYMDNKVNEFQKQQKKTREQARRREGEVTIEYNPGNQSKNKPSTGEYTDYVEIKD